MKVAFYLLSTWIMICGMAAISQKSMMRCAIALIGFFGGIAGIFFILHAEFLGAVQLMVYVGAIAVLILFAVMLTRPPAEEGSTPLFNTRSLLGWMVSLMVLLILLFTVQASILSQNEIPSVTVQEIGSGFMTRFAVPFEIISLLLTAAMIAAVVIAVDDRKSKKS